MKWEIDNSHSVVDFSVKHLMISTVKGSFRQISGSLEFDEASPTTSQMEAVIHVASIHTSEERRDNQLRSPVFFDVEKYPYITFKSTKVETVSPTEYKVTGNLTVKDVTKEIVLDVEYSGQATNPFDNRVRAGFTTTTSLNRSDFGLNWNVALETGGVVVSESVKIGLNIEAIEYVPALA